jgi:glycosyltransferase involved in cell wall biosynthesis
MHCGSYSRFDLLHRSGMNDWASDVERGWLRRVDKIMVFSEHHKRQLIEHRSVPEFKIRVVPFPAALGDLEYHRSEHKSIRVVWPHRPGPDKASEEGRRLLSMLEESGLVFRTWERCKAKPEYYHALGRAEYVVCWPPSETFGIAAMEGGYLGAMPIVPNRLSYKELYSHRFDTVDSAFKYITTRKPIPIHGPWEKAHTGFDVVWAELDSLTALGGEEMYE